MKLTKKQLDRLEAICKKKDWANQAPVISQKMCPVCEFLIRTREELDAGVHKNCLKSL